MYRIYNEEFCMFQGEAYENYVDVLAQYYYLTHFQELPTKIQGRYYYRSYEKYPYSIRDNGSRIDILTYVGNDGSSFQKSQDKGTWVYRKIYAHLLRWDTWKLDKLIEKGYKYRQGPVPGVHKRSSWHIGLRHMGTFPEARDNCDPEIQEYVRPRRNWKNLPNAWDDYFYVRPKSWKHQCKAKHQYSKHWK